MTWWEPSRNWRWWGTASGWSPSVVPTWSSQCQRSSTWITLRFCSWLRWERPPSRLILFTLGLTVNPAASSNFTFTDVSTRVLMCLFVFRKRVMWQWVRSGTAAIGRRSELVMSWWVFLSVVIGSKLASAADTFIRLVLPGSPAEGGLGLVGLSSSRRSAVLAASALLRAELPRCHARGGQSDDAMRDCVSRDMQANISFPAAWRTMMAAGTLGLTRQMGSQIVWTQAATEDKKTSFTCSLVVTTCQIVNTEFLSTHHVKSFFFF